MVDTRRTRRPSSPGHDEEQPAQPQHAHPVLSLQAAAGNQAVTRLLQRDLGAPPKAPQKTAPDAFLLSRTSTFEVKALADVYLVVLDRVKHPWHAEYTKAALADAAYVALVLQMFETTADANAVLGTRQAAGDKIRLTGSKEPEAPPDVQPRWMVTIDKSALSVAEKALNLSKLTGHGESVEKRRKLGVWMIGVIADVALRWGSIRSTLNQQALKDAGVSERALFSLITSQDGQRILASVALYEPVAEKVVAAYDEKAPPSATMLDDASWGDVLRGLAIHIKTKQLEEFEERLERGRKHQLNEALRPHEIGVKDAAQFILEKYDPNSFMIVDFMGPSRLEGGMKITNVKGQPLFLLYMTSDEVIYQNEANKRFYRQSRAGIEHELRYGVYALVAEKTKGVLKLTNFIMRVTGTIFPVAGYVYTASQVLDAAQGLYHARKDLERLYDEMMISRANLDKVAPGMVEAAVVAGAGAAVAKLLSPKSQTLAYDEWIIAIIKIALRRAGKAAATEFAGEAASTAFGQLWAAVKKVMEKIGAAVFYATTVGKAYLKSGAQGAKEKPKDADAISELTRMLKGVGITMAVDYAKALLAASSDERDQMVREIEEFKRLGTEMVAVLKQALAP